MTSKPAEQSPGEEPRPEEPPPCCDADRVPIFNAATIEALEDAQADRHLTRYRDVDELFRKLDIGVRRPPGRPV